MNINIEKIREYDPNEFMEILYFMFDKNISVNKKYRYLVTRINYKLNKINEFNK